MVSMGNIVFTIDNSLQVRSCRLELLRQQNFNLKLINEGSLSMFAKFYDENQIIILQIYEKPSRANFELEDIVLYAFFGTQAFFVDIIGNGEESKSLKNWQDQEVVHQVVFYKNFIFVAAGPNGLVMYRIKDNLYNEIQFIKRFTAFHLNFDAFYASDLKIDVQKNKLYLLNREAGLFMVNLKPDSLAQNPENLIEIDGDFFLSCQGAYKFEIQSDQIFVILLENNHISFLQEYLVDFEKREYYQKDTPHIVGSRVDRLILTPSFAVLSTRGTQRIYVLSRYSPNNYQISSQNFIFQNSQLLLDVKLISKNDFKKFRNINSTSIDELTGTPNFVAINQNSLFVSEMKVINSKLFCYSEYPLFSQDDRLYQFNVTLHRSLCGENSTKKTMTYCFVQFQITVQLVQAVLDTQSRTYLIVVLILIGVFIFFFTGFYCGWYHRNQQHKETLYLEIDQIKNQIENLKQNQSFQSNENSSINGNIFRLNDDEESPNKKEYKDAPVVDNNQFMEKISHQTHDLKQEVQIDKIQQNPENQERNQLKTKIDNFVNQFDEPDGNRGSDFIDNQGDSHKIQEFKSHTQKSLAQSTHWEQKEDGGNRQKQQVNQSLETEDILKVNYVE